MDTIQRPETSQGNETNVLYSIGNPDADNDVDAVDSVNELVRLKRLFCGIDLGLNGGIFMMTRTMDVVFMSVMPTMKTSKKKKVYDVEKINFVLSRYRPYQVLMERPKLVFKSGKWSAFVGGYGLGMFEGLCRANNIKYDTVDAITWQKVMLDMAEGKDTKEKSIFQARKLFKSTDFRYPKSKYHDGLTDSALIAFYSIIMQSAEKYTTKK